MFGNCIGLTARSRDLNVVCRELNSIFGNAINGLWLGEDIITDGNGYVTSWPSRITNYPLTPRGTNTGHYGKTNLNGRQSLGVANTSYVVNLHNSSLPVTKTFIIITDGTTDTVSNKTLLDIASNNTGAMLVLAGSTVFYQAGGWTHYIDGISNETVPISGVHIIEAVNSSGAMTGIEVGQWTYNNNAWPGRRALILSLNRIITSTERILITSLLKSYYNITDLAIG